MTGAQGFIVWDDIWLILINFKQLKQSSIYSNHGGAQARPAGVAFAGIDRKNWAQVKYAKLLSLYNNRASEKIVKKPNLHYFFSYFEH